MSPERLSGCVRRLLLLLTILSVLGFPGSAAAKIVPGVGIARVEIGFSEAHVRKLLGSPKRIVPPEWLYKGRLKGRIGFNTNGRVNRILTTSKIQRTGRHVGPGVCLRRTRNAYSGATCKRRQELRWSALCFLTSGHGGSRVHTDFLFDRQLRLQMVDIYRG
jgi:hypothetical protein